MHHFNLPRTYHLGVQGKGETRVPIPRDPFVRRNNSSCLRQGRAETHRPESRDSPIS